MKRKLSLLMAFALTLTIANAQFSVMLVDDDNNTAEAAPIDTALTKWGGTFGTFTTANDVDTVAPSYDDIKDYDMVIWYTGNDGITELWDYSDTTGVGMGGVRFNDAVTQFVDNGGILWIDGLDFIYDIYGGAPDDFAAGDFVYDKLGITQYLSQSKSDDGGSGVAQMDKADGNTVTTVDPVSWTFSSLWYADGYAINDNAVALYEMGPSDYALAGQVSAFYYNNIIVSSLRIAKLATQDNINTLVSEMVTAAQNGTFNATGIEQISEAELNIYPNPVKDIATVNLPVVNAESELSIFDISGAKVYSQIISAGQKTATVNVSGLSSGIYTVLLSSGNDRVATKLSVVR